jgi:hypothetical protein
MLTHINILTARFSLTIEHEAVASVEQLSLSLFLLLMMLGLRLDESEDRISVGDLGGDREI